MPQTLDQLAAYEDREYTVQFSGEPARLRGAAVSSDLFPLLGLHAIVGRLFGVQDGIPGAHPVVLSERIWLERFGRRPDVIGQPLVIDGQAHTIVGVAPSELSFPALATNLWTLLSVPSGVGRDGTPRATIFRALGRLTGRATPRDVELAGTQIARRLGDSPVAIRAAFGAGGAVSIRARPLAEEMTADLRPAVYLLCACLGCVLLVSCANVGHLFTSRVIARRNVFAIKRALGAGDARLARETLIEGLRPLALSGALGLLVATCLTRVVPSTLGAEVRRLPGIAIDGSVIAFWMIVTVLVMVLVLLPTVIAVSRKSMSPQLPSGEHGAQAIGPPGRGRTTGPNGNGAGSVLAFGSRSRGEPAASTPG
ncbi:MAG: ABC transporter permease [Acidobacteria bacterium]|nr:ABC transporter permease [Acidobacteriota bacterium]